MQGHPGRGGGACQCPGRPSPTPPVVGQHALWVTPVGPSWERLLPSGVLLKSGCHPARRPAGLGLVRPWLSPERSTRSQGGRPRFWPLFAPWSRPIRSGLCPAPRVLPAAGFSAARPLCRRERDGPSQARCSRTFELSQCEGGGKGVFLLSVMICVRVVLRLSEAESYFLIHT